MPFSKPTLAEQIMDRCNPDMALSYAPQTQIAVNRNRKFFCNYERLICMVQVLIVIHRRRHDPDFIADLHQNSLAYIAGIVKIVRFEVIREVKPDCSSRNSRNESISVSDRSLESGDVAGIDLLVQKERIEAVRQYLSEGARGDDRWVIQRNVIEGVTLREIAEDLGKTTGGVAFQKYRGMNQMRIDLAKYDDC